MSLHPTGSLEWQRAVLADTIALEERGAADHQAQAEAARAGGDTPYRAEIYQACADKAGYLAAILRAALAGLPSDAECRHQAEGAAMLAARELMIVD